MSIPVKLSESVFQKYIEPYLSKAKRGYTSKIPLYKIFNYILYVLYTGCQWQSLPDRISLLRCFLLGSLKPRKDA